MLHRPAGPALALPITLVEAGERMEAVAQHSLCKASPADHVKDYEQGSGRFLTVCKDMQARSPG